MAAITAAMQRKYGKLITPVQIIVLPGSVTTRVQAKKKVKKLKARPQDIIVHNGHAGHFDGKSFIGATGPHEGSSSDKTLVKLSASKQSMIAWSSKHRFSIVDIQPIEGYAYKKGSPYAGPNNPFYRELPFRGGGKKRVILSGPIRPDAEHGQFKVILKIGGRRIDPHIETGP